MYTGLYSTNFAEVFSKLLEKTGISCYRISQYAGVNEAYLSRLKNGHKHNPSPETIVRISLALAHLSNKISIFDAEALLNAAGRSILARSQRNHNYQY